MIRLRIISSLILLLWFAGANWMASDMTKAETILSEFSFVCTQPKKRVPNTPPEVPWEERICIIPIDFLNEYLERVKAEEEAARQARAAELARRASNGSYSGRGFKTAGVIYFNGFRWTYYSQRVLPGSGLNIPGRHVDGNGYVCDGNGYICLASMMHTKGTVLATPLGKAGCVYDYCETYGTIDVYVDW